MRARLLLAPAAFLTIGLSALLASRARHAEASATALPRVSFVAARGSSILVHGTYPHHSSPCVRPSTPVLHARFPGTIEVGKAPDGTLFVIGELPFEAYLKGIAEMPRTWPMEALKAQAVAARSYALAHMRYPDPTGEELGYQLCATDACQVYLGMGVSAGPNGDRWRSAVSSTAGQALLYGGRPADTLYFSTSNGRTVGNESVFGTAPLPYLRPVTEDDDGSSPLSHWRATISLDNVRRFLSEAGAWSGGRLESAVTSGSDVVLTSSSSPRTRRLSISAFRLDMNSWASCLDPSAYPGINGDNGTSLPQTVPSIWFSMSTRSGNAVLEGRGWGHGVGMVQWGAYGKALRGLSYRTILADYYGGLTPVAYDEPATIRVGIATGLSAVEVAGTGTVAADGTTVASGPWSVSGGKRLRVKAGPQPPTYITAGRIVRCAKRTSAGRRIQVRVDVPQLSVVRVLLTSATGPPTAVSRAVTVSAGTQTLRAHIPATTVTGRYRVQVEVTNGTDIVDTPSRPLHVRGVPLSPSPSVASSSAATLGPGAAPASGPGGGVTLVVALGALVAVLAVGAVLLRARRLGRKPQTTA